MYHPRILVVDDNILFLSRLEKDLIELGYEKVEAFSDVQHAIKYANENAFDIAILDINLQGVLSGIDLARNILKEHHKCIFITSYSERSIYEKAQHLKATSSFIVKPFDKLTLLSVLERFSPEDSDLVEITDIDSNDPIFFTPGNQFFFLKSNFTISKILFDELVCFEVDGNYTVVVTNDKKYAIKVSLRKILKIFNNTDLVQVHRNFIIYLPKINKINLKLNEILIGDDNYPIPLSNTYKKQIIEKIK